MFYGEFEGLKTILSTKTILTPRPIAVGHTEDKSKYFIVMENVPMITFIDRCSRELGKQLANMHKYNLQNSTSLVPMQIFKIFFFSIC